MANSVSLPPPMARCRVWPHRDREQSLRGYQAEHLIKGALMASLTDFLSNLHGSSGRFFSGSMFCPEPGSPPGWRWASSWHWASVCGGFARGTHLQQSLPLAWGHPAGAQTLLPGSQPTPAAISLLISWRGLWVQSLLLWPLYPPLCCFSLNEYLLSSYYLPRLAPVTGDAMLGQREMVLLSWSLQSRRGDKQRQHKNKQGRMVPNVRSTMK